MSYEKSLMPTAFQFSAAKQEVRSFLIENEPWMVAKDVCDILGISKYRDAISKLDPDERGSVLVDTLGGKQRVSTVSESGLYALIMRSNKPEAKTFRKWVTAEVLPSLRKTGYYATSKKVDDFIDARDTPYGTQIINNYKVRCIEIDGETWYSLNDISRAIQTSTGSYQAAKKLNGKQKLACKIWLFGNTNAAWFTNALGIQLIVSGSRVLKADSQLTLGFTQKGGESDV